MALVGYTVNGFRFYDNRNQKVINSRDVKFMKCDTVKISFNEKEKCNEEVVDNEEMNIEDVDEVDKHEEVIDDTKN